MSKTCCKQNMVTWLQVDGFKIRSKKKATQFSQILLVFNSFHKQQTQLRPMVKVSYRQSCSDTKAVGTPGSELYRSVMSIRQAGVRATGVPLPGLNPWAGRPEHHRHCDLSHRQAGFEGYWVTNPGRNHGQAGRNNIGSATLELPC